VRVVGGNTHEKSSCGTDVEGGEERVAERLMVALQESVRPTTGISCRAKEDCPSCEGAPNVWWVTHTIVTKIKKWKISGKDRRRRKISAKWARKGDRIGK